MALSRENIIRTRVRGLNHFDLVVQQVSRPVLFNALIASYHSEREVLTTLKNIFPETPINEWQLVHEALFKQIRLAQPGYPRLAFNLDEALTDQEILKLAQELSIIVPYQPQFFRP